MRASGILVATFLITSSSRALALEPGPESLDAALAVVLRSGCVDGVPALEALAERADLTESDRAVARRVVVICRRVQADGIAPGAPPAAGPAAMDRSGRGKLVFASTLYGIWGGIALDILTELEGRAVVLPPLIGGAAGFGLSLMATRDRPLTSGQAWGIITGLDYGTYSGLLWGAAVRDDSKVVVGTALATGLLGGAAATWLMQVRPPSQGDVELVRSGGLWGFATGGLVSALVQPDGSGALFGLMGGGMDGGLLVGLLLASQLELPRNRVLLIDTSALGGGLLGFAAAFLAIGSPDGSGDERLLAGSALAGMYAGIAAGAYFTRGMLPDQQDARLEVPALVARRSDGSWGLGRPTLVPWLSREGGRTRLDGLLAPLVGGLW